MTLILAVGCTHNTTGNPMLLIASDKQASTAYLQSEVIKIKHLPDKYSDERPCMIFAAAGDAYLADEICDAFDSFISTKYEEMKSVHLFINTYRATLSDLVGNIFNKYKVRGYESTINLFLCGCDKTNGPIILNIVNEGLNMISYEYNIIGTGSITGGGLLLRELYNPSLDDVDAGMLSMLIIGLVSKIDRSVGMGIDVYSCMDNKVLDIPTEQFEEAISITEERWNIIKKLWWNMNYEYVSTNLKAVLDAFEELKKKEK